ncbi:MAG: hypothetical protein AMJ54_03555 [Deltaproteobacteria bacterium SG8_13]|nr:MAG: hypothetical protein AMJ54_03555 [Deltaproteobacteria bacterium SG8_13]
MKNSPRALLAVLVALLLSAGSGICADPQGYEIIDTQQVKQMMGAEDKPLLAFTLSPIEFAIEHIPGSTCIPFELIGNYYEMPEDSADPIVFYCHGPG